MAHNRDQCFLCNVDYRCSWCNSQCGILDAICAGKINGVLCEEKICVFCRHDKYKEIKALSGTNRFYSSIVNNYCKYCFNYVYMVEQEKAIARRRELH